jgi:hypothetical protein
MWRATAYAAIQAIPFHLRRESGFVQPESSREVSSESPSRAPLWLVHGLAIFFVFMVAKMALAFHISMGGHGLGVGPRWLAISWFHDDILVSLLVTLIGLWASLAAKNKTDREMMAAERLVRWFYMAIVVYVAIQLPFSAWEQDTTAGGLIHPSWSVWLRILDSPRGSYALMGSASCLLVAVALPSLLGHLSQRVMVWFLAGLFLVFALLGPPTPQSKTPRVLEENPVAAFLRQRYNVWLDGHGEGSGIEPVDTSADDP